MALPPKAMWATTSRNLPTGYRVSFCGVNKYARSSESARASR